MSKKIISIVSIVVIVVCAVLVVLVKVPFKVTDKPYIMDFDDGKSEVGIYTGKWSIFGAKPADDSNGTFTYESNGVDVTIKNTYKATEQVPEHRFFSRAADGKLLLEITHEYSSEQEDIKTYKYYDPKGSGYVIYKGMFSDDGHHTITSVTVYLENGDTEELEISGDDNISGSSKAVKYYNNIVDSVTDALDGVTGI